jgi:hypothetical protein
MAKSLKNISPNVIYKSLISSQADAQQHLATREMQIQITMRYHFKPAKRARQ